jgi:uncharacterized membrane protein
MSRLFFAFFGIVLLLAPVATNSQVPIENRQSDASVIEMLGQTKQESGLFDYRFIAKTEYGEEFTIDTSESYISGIGYDLDVGDSVSLQITEEDSGAIAYLEDIHREKNLGWMVLIFAIIAVAVGRWRGVLSLLGLIVTIGILFGYLFPSILAGNDPVTSTVIASIVILAVNMHLSHGLKRQTFLAFLGTTVGLAFVVIFTKAFIYFGSLSGLASEEATLLFWETGSVNLPVGILAAGIILGAVGVLDDVAITQSEVVNELLLANPNKTKKELFVQAMRIGRHHIASTVNTLVLVYAGAALPVFLLFVYGDLSTQAFFNNELVAEEMIRTLAGTCALVLTVPISTWFATLAPRVVDKSHKHH